MKEDIINFSNAGLALEEIAEELGCDEVFFIKIYCDKK